MGHIQKRGKDRWRARYVDPDGQERSKTFPRRVEAERFLSTIEADKLRGSYLDPELGRVGFATFADEWLQVQLIRPGSRAVYESYLRNWLLPGLAGHSLASIRPTHVRRLVKDASESLSPQTVWAVHSLLSTIMSAAVQDGYIARNPCASTTPSKPRRAKVVPLAATEVHALMEAIQPRCRPIVALGAGCGLRLGEVLGLRLDRVRFLDGELDVVEQVVLNPGSPPRVAPPKTRSSVRSVPLPAFVADELALHLREAGVSDPSALVFSSRQGRPLWSSWFYKWAWQPAVARAGLPRGTRFHDLRHFYASALIAAGESVKTVQAAMGHASAVETLETYAGLWPDAPERTRAAVDALMLGRAGTGLCGADGPLTAWSPDDGP